MAAIGSSKRSFRSGDLAQAAGVSTDTLRHYERLGILRKPPRTGGGYRCYPTDALDRVNLIRNALDSGFTLRELITILRVRDAGGAPCQQVVEVAREKVERLEIQIAQLTRLRNSLKSTLRDWDRRLKETPDGGQARLLESLPKAKIKISSQGESHEIANFRIGTDDADIRKRSKRKNAPQSRTVPGTS
jgi:DNA-binding transcriptional MerR regulator